MLFLEIGAEEAVPIIPFEMDRMSSYDIFLK
jgi:hypothetical protein